ncbi:MAG: tyrosine-type recombinase/integrase [Chloroflexi bacterium]|nr:tyrosine-type recombinase/integrase [Chloroflexota bacterium]
MNNRALTPQHRTDLVGSTIPPVKWREALDTFLNTLNSPRTAMAYQRAVIEAMGAMEVDYVSDVTAKLLAEYRGWLVSRLDAEREDKLSPATVNLKLAGLRQFLRFCLVTGITGLSKDAIAFVLKSPKSTVEKPYEVLNQSERVALLTMAQDSNPREHALITLGLGAGLRVSELVKVRLENFSQDEAGNWWVLVKMGKGRKDRFVPVAASVMDTIKVWIADSGRDLTNKTDKDTFLFCTRQSPRMTSVRAWQIVKELARKAGIQKPISPHSLRHTMAIETLRGGASAVVVQKMLGHSTLAPTQRYLDHLERSDLAKWAFSPVG